jgi:hypothetical protein
MPRKDMLISKTVEALIKKTTLTTKIIFQERETSSLILYTGYFLFNFSSRLLLSSYLIFNNECIFQITFVAIKYLFYFDRCCFERKFTVVLFINNDLLANMAWRLVFCFLQDMCTVSPSILQTNA